VNRQVIERESILALYGELGDDRLLSNKEADCTGVPTCIWQGAAGTFTFDPASGLVHGRFEYQRNTCEYELRVLPQWRPVRYKEAHWGFDLDGQGVHAGFGEQPRQALAVEAYRVDRTTVRMRIVLPPVSGVAEGSKGRRIALAYSVSDGRRQVGLLATSGYRHANPAGFTWIGEPDPF
jgi:hypothetical protein